MPAQHGRDGSPFFLGDEAAEGMTDHHDWIGASDVHCERSGVVGPALHRQLGLVGSTRPSIATMVVVDELQARRQWVEASVEGVVDAETTVHHERRRPGADLLVKQLHPIDIGDRHISPLTRSATTLRFVTRPDPTSDPQRRN